MKTAIIGLVLGYGVVAALPCGNVRVPNVGNANINDAAEVAQRGVRAKEEANRTCDPIKKSEIGFAEELSMGGGVAVNFVASNGGLYLDYNNAEPVEALRKPEAVKLTNGKATEAARYVTVVGKNLGLQSSRSAIEWKFGILNNEKVVNAFSAPGGYVLITRALLQKVANEDQLAGVLAHEIGHVVARHALNLYRDSKANSCYTGVYSGALAQYAASQDETAMSIMNAYRAMAAAGSAFDPDDAKNWDIAAKMTDSAAETLTTIGYSKDQEFEADRIATDLMLSAGYSVDEFKKFLAALPSDGGFFAHHPPGAERVKAIDEHVNDLKAKNPFSGAANTRKPVNSSALKAIQ